MILINQQARFSLAGPPSSLPYVTNVAAGALLVSALQRVPSVGLLAFPDPCPDGQL